jgi:hypothetical protein
LQVCAQERRIARALRKPFPRNQCGARHLPAAGNDAEQLQQGNGTGGCNAGFAGKALDDERDASQDSDACRQVGCDGCQRRIAGDYQLLLHGTDFAQYTLDDRSR